MRRERLSTTNLMESENKLKYGHSKENYYEGVVVEVSDCAVAIDVKGRLGYIKAPMRMFISDYPFEVGQTVGFHMSFIEQLGPEVNTKYVSNIQTRNRRADEIKSKFNEEE